MIIHWNWWFSSVQVKNTQPTAIHSTPNHRDLNFPACAPPRGVIPGAEVSPAARFFGDGKHPGKNVCNPNEYCDLMDSMVIQWGM
jgi:hypothetical protein